MGPKCRINSFQISIREKNNQELMITNRKNVITMKAMIFEPEEFKFD